MITVTPRHAITAGILVMLITATALQSWRLDQSQRRNHAFAETIAKIRAAQAHAADRARLAKHDQEARYRTLAERTNQHAEQAQALAMADARRFIDDIRVRCPENGSSSGNTRTYAQTGITESIDRSGKTPQLAQILIPLPEEDILICTENTMRLTALQNWSKDIQKN